MLKDLEDLQARLCRTSPPVSFGSQHSEAPNFRPRSGVRTMMVARQRRLHWGRVHVKTRVVDGSKSEAPQKVKHLLRMLTAKVCHAFFGGP